MRSADDGGVRVSIERLQRDVEFVGVDGDTLGAVVRLVDPDEAIGTLEHLIAKRNDDELRVLRSLLKKTQNITTSLTSRCHRQRPPSLHRASYQKTSISPRDPQAIPKQYLSDT